MKILSCVTSPLTCVAGKLTSLTVNGFFDGLAHWVASSVVWLIHILTATLTATSDAHSVISAATPEYQVLLSLAPWVMLVSLLVVVLSGLRHGESGTLWRSFAFSAPLCAGATLLAPSLAQLVLELTNGLCNVAASNLSSSEQTIAHTVTSLNIGVPGFGIFLVAGIVAIGAFLLWCDLIVRAVILALLLALVPLIIPLAVIASMRRVALRLVETFVTVALSKVVIVVALSLGVHELSTGNAVTLVSGGVTLLMAAATPFVLLRMVPLIEHSALHGLEGLRQRAVRAGMSASASPAGQAMQMAMPSMPLPGPPERTDDFGLDYWQDVVQLDLPPVDAQTPPPPILPPTPRTGRMHMSEDEMGPKMLWHWDD